MYIYKVTFTPIFMGNEVADPTPPDNNNVWEVVSSAATDHYLYFTWKLVQNLL